MLLCQPCRRHDIAAAIAAITLIVCFFSLLSPFACRFTPIAYADAAIYCATMPLRYD